MSVVDRLRARVDTLSDRLEAAEMENRRLRREVNELRQVIAPVEYGDQDERVEARRQAWRESKRRAAMRHKEKAA